MTIIPAAETCDLKLSTKAIQSGEDVNGNFVISSLYDNYLTLLQIGELITFKIELILNIL